MYNIFMKFDWNHLEPEKMNLHLLLQYYFINIVMLVRIGLYLVDKEALLCNYLIYLQDEKHSEDEMIETGNNC